MNMAHAALVRQLMEEAECGRLETAAVEYWTDPVGGKRRRVHVEVSVYDVEDIPLKDAEGA